ncbi:polysaccharide deacetylase [Loktanella sp. 3ANDIMAR09]|uniref:allantoinase PuuE n=1 Tax=Loktanella sp. 3ANDIMAR09 TaxID=1225657 RepID=UPI0007005BAE|nr:allantoinase PuuE [Loktanella sp. 3ANDIMAR09]KQI70151.1 polysaccharide deacetylase [Loktanella sp. 3ANDIMAR09]
MTYPRDMIGYGARTPDPKWPNGSKIAVQIVVNYEEGGENNILHGDPASEAFLSEIPGAVPWPGQRHWNMETIYEYGARAGFWRLHRLLHDTPVTVFGVATALARGPEQVAAMQASGWEIASHGLKWIEYKDTHEDTERTHIQRAVRLHTEVTGERPRGFYQGRASMNSMRLAAEEGFDYLADSYADDLPFWQTFGGKDHLVVPYTLDANDMRFSTPNGFNAGDQFFDYLRASFDALYREGVEGAPKMMSIGLHCRLAGRPGRIEALRKFMDHARSHDGVWFATRAQIADHWRAHHPAPTGLRPSQMDQAAFVAKFGGVYEHSPWVAEEAFKLERSPAHDTPVGLANLMARAFRRATPEARLDVLRAHPDLAGKLAAAKRLTADSTSEQASAGLDALTDAERSLFQRANEAYTKKYGFPFIIAVRDNTKDTILDAFETRLNNTKEQEFVTACEQVNRIAALRLQQILG